MRRVVLIVFLSLAFGTAATGATLRVPSQYLTIMDAVNASVRGDIILVAPGTYREHIDFGGRAITLKSESGPGVTTIEGNSADEVVLFRIGESATSVLEGFTITNGGTGITCVGAEATIRGNVISNNRRSGLRYAFTSGLIVTGNRIESNGSEGVNGYGAEKTMISDCTIESNGGPGILLTASLSPTFKDVEIAGNQSGIECSHCDGVTFSGCRSVSNQGSGIRCSYSEDMTMVDSIFQSNGSLGIYCSNVQGARFSGNLISDNALRGITCRNSDRFEITGNLITSNVAAGIECTDCLSADITCNIVWMNTGDGIHVSGASSTRIEHDTVMNNGRTGIYVGTPLGEVSNSITRGNTISQINSPSVTFCNVQGGYPGTGNFDLDPLFADPGRGDFHLTLNSPCRDAGVTLAGTGPHDFEGDPRIVGPDTDVGADEYHYHLYSVGGVLPGSSMEIKVVGIPGLPTLLALGSGIQNPPQPTPHGDLWLKLPPAGTWQLGTIPGTGILTHAATVPSGCPSGSIHPFQALVGPWGGGATRLTNLLPLEVE